MSDNPKNTAFPAEYKSEMGQVHKTMGLTKREFAAIKIMAGILANSDVEYETDEELTADVIRMTDALIEALNK